MIVAPLLALALAGCNGASEAPAPAPAPAAAAPRPDVVIVTLDTTRADRLGSYGYAQARTDWLDAKAAAGMRFTRAYAVQPLTIPSHASIMTGLWPWRHGVRSNGDAVLGEEVETLAERYRAGGYQTVASVAAFVTTRTWGFSQGFDAYLDELAPPAAAPPGAPGAPPAATPPGAPPTPEGQPDAQRGLWHQERPAGEVVDDAIGWLEGAASDKPMFMWVHLYDAHFPYAPPEPYASELPDRPYDGEIAYVDDQLQRLDEALRAKGRDPVWVIVGDHGESLGDHRELTHGLFVYDATQHVPFIMSGPGISPQVVDQPVSHVDLAPTLLSLTGRPLPEGIDGKVQPGNPHPAWMESFQLTEQYGYAPHLGVVDGAHKLISKPRPELYDLVADPGERQDLSTDQPAEVARMRQVLEQLGPVMPEGRTQPLDPDALARLQALGYIPASSFDVDFADLPDPWDHRETIGKVLRTDMLRARGETDKAIALMREALVEQPEVPHLHTRLARLLVTAKQPKEAQAVTLAAAERFKDNADIQLSAATMLGKSGQDARSLELARAVLEKDPDNDRAAEFVAGALMNLGRTEELLAFADAWLATHPDAHYMSALKGIHLMEQMQLGEAEKALRHAAEDDRPRQGVCQRLAALAMGANAVEDARRWLLREVETHGDSAATARLRMQVYIKLRKHDEILAEVDGLIAKAPKDPALHYAKTLALFEQGQVDPAAAAATAGLAVAPEDPELLLMHANILLKQGKVDEAKAVKAQADAAHQRRVEAMKAKLGK